MNKTLENIIAPKDFPMTFTTPYVGLLHSHVKTLESMGISGDHDFICGLKRAIEIIEEATPKIKWKGNAE